MGLVREEELGEFEEWCGVSLVRIISAQEKPGRFAPGMSGRMRGRSGKSILSVDFGAGNCILYI